MKGRIVLTLVVLLLVGLDQLRPRLSGPVARPGWSVLRPPREVLSMVFRGEELWMGSETGLYCLRSGKVESVTLPFPIHYVRALAVDREGDLWVGHGGGLAHLHGDRWVSLGGLPDDRVTALLATRDGGLYAGTPRGLGLWRDGRWSVALAEESVNVLFEDAQGGVWVGTTTGGLTWMGEGGKTQRFTTAEGLPHNMVNALAQEGGGALWVGTGLLERGGAVRMEFRQGSWAIVQSLTVKDGLAGAKVRSVFVDRAGTVWFGSEYDGVAQLARGRWSLITTRDGLSHQEVMVMVQGSDGTMWLGTRDGLNRVAP